MFAFVSRLVTRRPWMAVLTWLALAVVLRHLAPAWDQVLLRPGKLFIVGDPKQSIYAFRRADIETYERAKEVLLRSGGVEDITANFRSAAPVLTAVNEIFQGRMRRPPDGRYQPDYVALNPSPGTRASPRPPRTSARAGRAGPRGTPARR